MGLATATFEEVYQHNRLSGPGILTVGRWTYWNYDSSFATFTPEDRIEIGAFCAFAAGTRVVAGGVHDTEAVSGYPFPLMAWTPGDSRPIDGIPGRVVLRNDVWVGTGAMILDGVEVGSGAVIGAGSTVVHDIPPYSIAVGSPAKPVRKRFRDDEIELLLRIGWWDWPDQLIREATSVLRGGSVAALADFAKQTGCLTDEEC